jgi:ABC-2 type transport system ATP-binding protein
MDSANPDWRLIPGVEKVTDFGQLQELKVASHLDHHFLLGELMKRGRITHFEVTRPSLHDIFVRIAGPAGPDDSQTAGNAAHA